jgi:hypothetical protein
MLGGTMNDRSLDRMRNSMAAMLAFAAIFVFSSTVIQAQTAAPAPAAAVAQPGTPAQPLGPVLTAKIAASLSSKNAKVGDTLTAKTLKTWKLTDGTELPKGSKLVAKVTSVKSKKDGNGNSILTFRFDQAEVKGGAAVPIHGFVVAIGPSLSPKDAGFGPASVMGRGGQGSTPGLDPNAGLGKAGARDEDNIALGSTMPGVALGRHLDADWTTALQGVRQDIDLDSDVIIKVQLK